MMSHHGALSRRVVALSALIGAAVILGCMDRSVTGPSVVGTADSLAVVAGNNQSGIVGTALTTPITISVKSSTGAPIAGTSVAFSVASGGGTVSPAVVSTDASGLAQTTWTLGTATGQQTVTASAGSKVLTLVASGVASGSTGGGTTAGSPPAAQVVLSSGNGQSGSIGQPLASAVVVKVVDSLGNAVSGSTVTFAMAAGNGSGGAVSPTSIKSDVNGLASTQWTLGSKVGQQTLTATVTGLTAVTIQATGSLGSGGAVIADNGNNQAAGSGAVLPTYVRVLVLDQAGNPALGARVNWSVASGGGAISKASGTTNAAGLDSAQWTLGSSIGTQTATATVTGVGSVTFSASATTVSGTAASLRIISGEGQTGQSAQALPLPLVVEVRDAGGNVLSGVTVKVTQAATNADAFTTPSPAVTGVDGRASMTWRVGTNTGVTVQTDSLTVSLTSFPAVTGVVFHAAVRPSFRVRMVNLADTMQVDTTGATLKDTLVVQVYDPVTGNGVQGVPVTWATQAPTAVDGFAVKSADTTDNNGLAKNRWVLRSSDAGTAIPSGPVAKRMVATATGVGQVEFKAHAYPGALRSVTASMQTTGPVVAGSVVGWCATVKDANGYNIDSATVTFSAAGGGATGGGTALSRIDGSICLANQLTTAGQWSFGVDVTSPIRPYQTTLPAIVWPMTEAAGTIVVTAGPVTGLAKVSGDAQTATRGTTLGNAIRIKVTDAYGNAVAGSTVQFAVLGGGGLLSSGSTPAATASVTSGADGTAAVTWTLGAAAGTNTVAVSANGLIVIFTATGS